MRLLSAALIFSSFAATMPALAQPTSSATEGASATERVPAAAGAYARVLDQEEGSGRVLQLKSSRFRHANGVEVQLQAMARYAGAPFYTAVQRQAEQAHVVLIEGLSGVPGLLDLPALYDERDAAVQATLLGLARSSELFHPPLARTLRVDADWDGLPRDPALYRGGRLLLLPVQWAGDQLWTMSRSASKGLWTLAWRHDAWLAQARERHAIGGVDERAGGHDAAQDAEDLVHEQQRLVRTQALMEGLDEVMTKRPELKKIFIPRPALQAPGIEAELLRKGFVKVDEAWLDATAAVEPATAELHSQYFPWLWTWRRLSEDAAREPVLTEWRAPLSVFSHERHGVTSDQLLAWGLLWADMEDEMTRRRAALLGLYIDMQVKSSSGQRMNLGAMGLAWMVNSSQGASYQEYAAACVEREWQLGPDGSEALDYWKLGWFGLLGEGRRDYVKSEDSLRLVAGQLYQQSQSHSEEGLTQRYWSVLPSFWEHPLIYGQHHVLETGETEHRFLLFGSWKTQP